VGYVLDVRANPVAAFIVTPILFVLIKLNAVLMVVALLPIGPFDGHSAWAAIPLLRNSWRRRRKAAKHAKLFPEENLSPERRQELEEASSKVASDLIGKLSKKPEGRKEDA
jgi:membrane-associated protease RseP (regulator of RpoE activity)